MGRLGKQADPQVARYAFDHGNASFANAWIALGSFASARRSRLVSRGRTTLAPWKASGAQSVGAPRSVTHLGEGQCGGGDELIVWHVAHVLRNVPAMPEWVFELAVPVAPEHVR